MGFKIRKIDVIIIVALIIIAGSVFLKVGYIESPVEPKIPEIDFYKDEKNSKIVVNYVSEENVLWEDINISGECNKPSTEYVHPGDELTECVGTITIKYKKSGTIYISWTFEQEEELPESFIAPNERSVSPKDEGPHYKNVLINREWWYYTVVFNKDSGLTGWTLTVSFNHMGRNDLFFEKPDLLFVALHSPDGKEYGGIIEKERPILGLLKEPSLQATGDSNGFEVIFDDSYARGRAPNWHLHIEGDEIDIKHDILIDLQYFAHDSPIWTYSNRPFDKSEGKVASYMFMGCDVKGTVEIDGLKYKVKGIGHHEHTWASGLVFRNVVRGWDWVHMKFNNGWNIYYSNYYSLPQRQSTKTSTVNPFANLIITTDQGKTLTKLENVDIEILESEKLFLLLNMPTKTQIHATASTSQILLKTYNIELNLEIIPDNTYDQTWKRLSFVGMKIGRSKISGDISWEDEQGEHMLNLEGIGTIWNMRH